MRLGVLKAIFGGLCILLAAMAPPAVDAAVSAKPGHYFLVIDHSGSMLSPVTRGPDAGKTRWQLMRERSSGFVERLPEGADLWVSVFSAQDPTNPNRDWRRTMSGRLDEANRSSMVGVLKSYPEPGQANGTWLYQATSEALDQVELIAQHDPEAFLTVMVYTDGVDQGHGLTSAQMARNPASKVGRTELENRINQFKSKYHNFNVVKVYQPGEESIRDAQVVRLQTNRIQLANPLAVPRQEFELTLAFRDSPALALEGRPLEVEIEGEDGRPLPLKVVGGPFRMHNGAMKVAVEKSGAWPPGQDQRARLKLGYPDVPNVFLVAEGGDAVDVYIQGANKPAINDLLPVSGSVFPAGRKVGFSLTTLPGASVEWSFADGGSAKGNPVEHAFDVPANRKVTVKVTDPRTQLSATAEVALTIAKLALTLDPMPTDATPDRQVTLAATADGNFRSFEWVIGGRRYAGTARTDGRAGTQLQLAFDRPGRYAVTAIGEGVAGGNVEAQAATLVVREVPTLRVTSPAENDTLNFGSTRELRAEVEGVTANTVQFTLMANGAAIGQSQQVGVRRVGPVRSAALSLKVPALPARTAAVLRVEAVGVQPALIKEVPVLLDFEPSSLEIRLPGGREPYIQRQTSLELDVHGQVKNLQWDFGDGAGPVSGTSVMRHVWTRYGDYVVRASGTDANGQRIEATPISVKVPIRPVRVKARVLYNGEELGAGRRSVSVNSTVELAAQTEGDVLRLRWFVDGKELPDGRKTVVVEEQGAHRVRVVAEGTPEAGNASSEVEFRTSDWIIYFSVLAGMVVALWLLGKLLLGNKWRLAQFNVVSNGRISKSERTKPDGQATTLKPVFGGVSPFHSGKWHWWAKKATFRPETIDQRVIKSVKGSEQHPDLQSYGWKDAVWTLRSKSFGAEVELLAPEIQTPHLVPSELNPENSSLGWLYCWRIKRPTVDSESEYARLGLLLRMNSATFLERYWPEFLFALAVVVFLSAWRYLHSVYF
jgi:PKD domain